jgi:hypothetical protein
MTVPITLRDLNSQLRTFYLGVPGSLQTLRMPDAGYSAPLQRGEVPHDLISGGTAVTRRRLARRAYGLAFSGCTPDTAAALVGFYMGDFGDGPFCFIDPAWRNQLTDAASTFGARAQAVDGWALSNPGAETATFSATIAPFTAPSGVAVWAGAGNGSHLGTGSWNGAVLVPDTTLACPYLTATTQPVSVYIRTASSTASVSLRGLAVQADGTVVSTTTTTVTATTAWQRVTALVPAALAAGTLYVLLDVLCNTASAPNIYLSCAGVQYGVTTPGAWVGGAGVPRVSVAGPLGNQSTLIVARDHALLLAEI